MKPLVPVLRARPAALTVLAVIALVVGGVGAVSPAQATSSTATRHAPSLGHSSFRLPSDVRRACAAPTRPGQASCLSFVRTNVASRRRIAPHLTPARYGPADLQ